VERVDDSSKFVGFETLHDDLLDVHVGAVPISPSQNELRITKIGKISKRLLNPVAPLPIGHGACANPLQYVETTLDGARTRGLSFSRQCPDRSPRSAGHHAFASFGLFEAHQIRKN